MAKLIMDVSEDDQKFYSKQYLNAGDLRENIEKLEASEPSDKRTKEHKKWAEKLNFLCTMYNIKVGYRAYKTKENAVRKRAVKKKDTGGESPVQGGVDWLGLFCPCSWEAEGKTEGRLDGIPQTGKYQQAEYQQGIYLRWKISPQSDNSSGI